MGEDSVETDEETGETTETFAITHLEFIDWGILPDDDEEEELTDEQIEEVVQDVVRELLELEVGKHEHAFYNSFSGYNLYRVPLEMPITIIGKGEEVSVV